MDINWHALLIATCLFGGPSVVLGAMALCLFVAARDFRK